MKFLAMLLPLTAVVLAVPHEQSNCTTPQVRVEWRSLTQEQRDSYHSATKCLQIKPSGVDGLSVYDLFAKNHVGFFRKIHYVAAFLPWHRYYSHAHFQYLKDCGYTGPAVYWDWTKDVNSMASSEIFDPKKGFGGTGKATRSGSKTYNCIQDGPYSSKSNFTITWPEKRCLQRSFNMKSVSKSWWSSEAGPSTRHSQTQIDEINKNKKFTEFWPDLEEGPHDSVHNEISGDMAASFSPDDPLFFLHHNNVDRLWALWQGRDNSRLNDYSENTAQTGRNATLDNPINIGIPGFPVANVTYLMDTQGSLLCYKASTIVLSMDHLS
ncbi:Tyrosinase OS=Streptomyces antibioticus GN=melC2 PE=3 SV=2 [Rhizoctonia solani AG-1 IB]|uniref:Tyrosinase n=1 Tax=Thanatephorus cucumeris (strain AG1-IB / isolate 7/3/14) TaxID=1108050 RepID=A0A0B7F3K0_THACB|nr:Tyrosinase OS=Streptomyces antibioticus GN=melC2 PE=3 SV=2 [Rhizoctonia solani AG-1 IB]